MTHERIHRIRNSNWSGTKGTWTSFLKTSPRKSQCLTLLQRLSHRKEQVTVGVRLQSLAAVARNAELTAVIDKIVDAEMRNTRNFGTYCTHSIVKSKSLSSPRVQKLMVSSKTIDGRGKTQTSRGRYWVRHNLTFPPIPQQIKLHQHLVREVTREQRKP